MPRRGARVLSAAVAVVIVAAAATAATAAGRQDPPLTAALGHALATPDIEPGRTAALAVDFRTGRVVFRLNPTRSLAPASAEKLMVSFAALRLLGPDYRFHTEVLGSGQLVGETWEGDLYLVGFGDPTLATSDLDSLARNVATWGIRRVTGSVIGDEHYYDASRAARGWKPSFLGVESPPLSALVVGHVPFRGANGSAAAAAGAFTRALGRRGISVAHAPRTGRAGADVAPLALDVSQALAAVVKRMDTESDNFIAEMLLKQLGASFGARGSTAAGDAVVRGALGQAGVPLAGVRLVDGSGLSLLDRLTVRALVTVLRAGAGDSDIRDAFLSSLAVAGVSGTLEDRLERRTTRGQVLAKTGTTDEASALAGFVGSRYVFAILQNGSPVDYGSARAAQDRFVTLLARS